MSDPIEEAEDHLHDTLDEWERVRRNKERARKRAAKKRQTDSLREGEKQPLPGLR